MMPFNAHAPIALVNARLIDPANVPAPVEAP